MNLLKLLFPRLIPLREHRRIVRTLAEQLERKNKRIEELLKEREVLLNSSLKQAHKNAEMQLLLQKLHQKNEEEPQ